MNTSIPKSTGVEFINIQPLNPMISKCEIKVLYNGPNRNRSLISKEVANRMANTLPGTPIVGEYLVESSDFGDHGEEEIVIDKNGVRFVKTTVPYGFISIDAKAWWADFMDKDGITREYMVTEGYLWTGRYPEIKRIVENGNHQSMEFDRDTLVGEWSKIENESDEYFIVSDATFSALCILGEDIEPCFEGANITKNSNLVYSLNKDDFKGQMLDFMDDLRLALNNFSYEGGKEMPVDTNIETPEVEVPVVEEPIVETPVVEEPAIENPVVEDDFAKKKEEEDEEDNDNDKNDDADNDDDDSEDEDEKKKKKEFAKEEEEKKEGKCEEEEDDKKKNKYSLEDVTEYQELLVKFNELETKFANVEAELNSIKPEYGKLKELQIQAENQAKDDMIGSFYMLSDEDKKDVIENKSNYSLDEIEAKLSVICVRNKVNFNLDDSSENESNTETPITTFAVDNTFDATPAWIKAVERVAKNRR